MTPSEEETEILRQRDLLLAAFHDGHANEELAPFTCVAAAVHLAERVNLDPSAYLALVRAFRAALRILDPDRMVPDDPPDYPPVAH